VFLAAAPGPGGGRGGWMMKRVNGRMVVENDGHSVGEPRSTGWTQNPSGGSATERA